MRINKKLIFEGILIYLTIGILFGAFKHFTRIPAFWPSVLLLIVYTISFNPKVFIKESFFWIYILLTILIGYNFSGYFTDFPKVHLTYFGVFSLVLPYLLSALVIENLLILKEKARSIIINTGKLSLLFIVINSIFTIISEFIFPGITRTITITGYPIWVIAHTFGAIYGLPFIMAALIACYRGKSFLILISFLIIQTSLLYAGFVTALLFTVIILIIAVLIRYNVKNIIYLVAILSVVMILAFNITEFIIKILPDLPNPAYSTKIKDFDLMAKGDSSYTNIRAGVYNVSLKSFKDNFWFGSGTWKSVGEHSYLLDRLGFLGLFGTFFFVIVLYKLFNRSLLIVPQNGIITYKYLFFVLAVLLFFNPFYNLDFWLIMYVYLPLLISYFLSAGKNSRLNFFNFYKHK